MPQRDADSKDDGCVILCDKQTLFLAVEAEAEVQLMQRCRNDERVGRKCTAALSETSELLGAAGYTEDTVYSNKREKNVLLGRIFFCLAQNGRRRKDKALFSVIM